ncbi:hypothetical protein [Vibrio tetraodonis]|uniref:hypothetical protein n=1 Tax=Vibrio tetraodonis TaxID=2231647 RepID=UPI000E0B7193|nr:hypothetical protein [Vibrio tetraodonis]
MENIEMIIATAIVTLVVTVLAGITVEYFKKIKPKLSYSIKESIPITLNDNKIGANVIEVHNPSSKTVKNITIRIKSLGVDIKNSGVNSTTGLDYDIDELGDSIEVKIPFLKFKDYVSITTIMEDRFHIPNKPEVTIRSPDQFKSILESKEDTSIVKRFDSAMVPATVAAMVVGLSLSISSNGIYTLMSARIDQSTQLTLAATKVDFPQLVSRYSTGNDFTYYTQGPYIYSLVMNSHTQEEVQKYYDFLGLVVQHASRINSSSKAALEFFIGRVSLVMGNESNAKSWFSASMNTDEAEYLYLKDIYGTTD